MVASGVVWCLKDDQWIPLQLSSIRLHGVITQAHWAAVSDFLQRFSNKQLILQDNGFKELTDQQSELLLKHQKNKLENKIEYKPTIDDIKCALQLEREEDKTRFIEEIKCGEDLKWQNLVVQENCLLKVLNGKTELNRHQLRTSGLSQIPEQDGCCQQDDPGRDSSLTSDNTNLDNNSNLFISNLFVETDDNKRDNKKNEDEVNKKKTERKLSEQNDEIVLRLLRKYCKYSRDALDDKILSEIEAVVTNDEEDSPPPTPSRRLSHCFGKEKLYENCNDLSLNFASDEHFENERNEHVLRWLKQQNKQKGFGDFIENKRDFTSGPSRKISVFSIGDGFKRNSKQKKIDEKSSCSSSGIDSRKSSVTSVTDTKKNDSRKSSLSSPCTSESRKSSFSNLGSRKSSVASNSSCSESDDCGGNVQWHKLLKKHLTSKKLEKRLQKQREAWARNTRKLSSGSESYSDLTLQE